MASPFIFHDSFDLYGPPGVTPALTTQWTSVTNIGVPAIVAGLSSSGYALRLPPSSSVNKTLSASYTRIAGSARFSNSQIGAVTNITFLNGATAAFTLSFETNGAVNLRTGAVAGTIIAGGGAVLANSTHVLSFDISVGPSAVYSVNLDGVLLFSGTTGNTGNGQTSVNALSLQTNGLANTSLTIDDFILVDPTQPNYNSALLTSNPVIETQFPSGDNQTQFANDGNAIPLAGLAARGVYRFGGATSAPGPNQLLLLKITPTASCSLANVSFVSNLANGVAKLKGVLYADSSGAPGALLNTGTEVVGVAAAIPTVLPFAAPSSLVGGTSYWIGLICDTGLTYQVADVAATNLTRNKNNTYTSGPPSPAGAGFSTLNTLYLWGNATGSAINSPSINLNPPLGTAASQIHSSTVGQEDLYTFDPLVTNPSTIFGMSVKGFVSKSDAGARTVSLNSKSGASDTTGSAPSQSLATTSQWQGSYFDLDPATGLPWTLSGANAAKGGVSVAS